ncbi:MAG: protein-S-isoprenylcysteine O-methyltransferase [Croceivirga sp.]
MEQLIFKLIFVAYAVGMGVIRRPFEKRNKNNTINLDKKDMIERVLLVFTFLGMSILPLVYILTSWLNFANYELPLPLGILGVLLLGPTLYLYYRSHKDLGCNWSVSLEIRDAHTLTTNGVYRTIRHPMYSAIWLGNISQALLLQNYIAGLSGLVGFGLLYFSRVKREEQMMESQFGDEYTSYKKKTKRLIPNFF